MNRWHWQNWEDSPYYKLDNGKTFPTNPVKESVAVLNTFKAIQPEWIIDYIIRAHILMKKMEI
ncbi:hypothetical protein SDC9_203757 [bioreactor metagenome]|uniref:Uncharacterized protein n=1 Tax=bioreactor metagenome TaxID=1076179 RepID=A0A645IXL0_9ZZZZ